ncbi:SAYSvFN domain-containing protein 1 [Macrobrachium rosenbergii]|uniref:SAYSvFN domain-containing protein 1 n=1 Tax=Macrobrachium rosenbergii TaxID=79674 RepID=UPI0034D6CC72
MSCQGKPSIEEQLSVYRTRKRKEEESNERKKVIWNWIAWIMNLGSSRSSSESSSADSSSTESTSGLSGDGKQEQSTGRERSLRRRPGGLSKESSSSFSGSDSQDLARPSIIDTYTKTDWIILGLKFIMWLLLFKIFILLEFGAVFFIFSAFVFIWYNMRSGPKRKGEISAYSVFNPNCEMIDGTFTAEQFERELLHKM